jgi:hypothetical protein
MTVEENKGGPQQQRTPGLIAIPGQFYSDATGKPFRNCIRCEKNLLMPGTHYLIEKAIRAYSEFETTDTVYEYAVCVSCYIEMRKELSQKSMQNLDTYFKDQADLIRRRDELLKEGSGYFDEWISECIIKHTPLSECSEYQLVCECTGDQLILSQMPYMVSGEAMDEMMDLLSDQTLDFLNGFRDRFLGPPQEVRDILRPSRVILL